MVQVQGYRSIDAIEPENGPFHIKGVYDVSHSSVPCVNFLPASIRCSCSAAFGRHAVAPEICYRPRGAQPLFPAALWVCSS